MSEPESTGEILSADPNSPSVTAGVANENDNFRDLLPKGPRPLVRPTFTSNMYGPIAVLIAILPGLYGLSHWDLTPPGPWWGLRGLAALDDWMWFDQTPMAEAISSGKEYDALRSVTMQPPLYVWMQAILLRFSPSRSPLVSVLPAYVSGVALILLVYLQARTWSKPGTAIIAAWIVGFHLRTLDSMQRAGPATLGAALILASLQFYSVHILVGQGGKIRGRIAYAVACGLCLGLSLMSIGLIGMMIVPIIILHQVALNAGESPLERPRHWYEAWRSLPGFFYGSSAMIVALCLAAPWHVWMTMVHGEEFWKNLAEPSKPLGSLNRGPIGHLLDASPIFLIPALYSGWLAIRSWFAGTPIEDETPEKLTRPEWVERSARDNLNQDRDGLILWTIWAVVSLAMCVYWPFGPNNTMGLMLTCSLALLAAHTVRGLSQRQIPAKLLIRLTPMIALGFCWWISPELRRAVAVAQTRGIVEAFTGGIAWVLWGMIALVLFIWVFGWIASRWIRRSDLRIRTVLALNLSLLLAFQLGLGVNELRFRHNITTQLIELRDSIVRRNQIMPIEHIHLVGTISPRDLAILRPIESDRGGVIRMRDLNFPPNPTGIDPAGRLRFILRSALPRVPQTDHATIDSLFRAPAGQRLVILVGTDSRLSIADQSRLSLEPIHPGVAKILTAFATTTRTQNTVYRPSSSAIGSTSVSIASPDLVEPNRSPDELDKSAERD